MIFENNTKIDAGCSFTAVAEDGGLAVYYTKNGCSHKATVTVGEKPSVVLIGKISAARQTTEVNGYLLRLSGGEISIE